MMAEDYYFPSAAIKVQATEQISIRSYYMTSHLVQMLIYSLEQSCLLNANGEGNFK